MNCPKCGSTSYIYRGEVVDDFTKHGDIYECTDCYHLEFRIRDHYLEVDALHLSDDKYLEQELTRREVSVNIIRFSLETKRRLREFFLEREEWELRRTAQLPSDQEPSE